MRARTDFNGRHAHMFGGNCVQAGTLAINRLQFVVIDTRDAPNHRAGAILNQKKLERRPSIN